MRGRSNRSLAVNRFSQRGEFQKSYESISEAHRDTGVNHGQIYSVSSNEGGMAGGYIWRFRDRGENESEPRTIVKEVKYLYHERGRSFVEISDETGLTVINVTDLLASKSYMKSKSERDGEIYRKEVFVDERCLCENDKDYKDFLIKWEQQNNF